MNNLAKENKVVAFPIKNTQEESKVTTESLKAGFTMITDEMMEAICCTRFSDQESRVLHAILRKTVRYGKVTDWISTSQIEDLTGIKKRHITNTILKLANRKIAFKNGKEIGVNPDFSAWLDKDECKNTLNKEKTTNPNQGIKIPQTGKGVTYLGNFYYLFR